MIDPYTVKKYKGCTTKLDEEKFAKECPEDWQRYKEIKAKMEPYKVRNEYDNISFGKA